MEKIVIDQLGVNEERTPLTFQLAERLPHIISGDPTAHDSGGSTGAGWHRTYGNTGWYNETYGGGFYMIDTTWLRAYNNKHIYTGGKVKAGEFCIWNDCITSWPSGGGGVAACSDCDSRFVNVTGDTITGSLTVNSNVTVEGNLVANANSHGTCYWLNTGVAEPWNYNCNNGDYLAGVTTIDGGDAGGAGINRIKCCKL